jgi:hypothetical protein
MRILFISPVFPFPATSGDRQRTHLMLNALRRLGEVDLVVASFGSDPDGFNVDMMTTMGASDCIFLSPKTRVGKWFRRLRLLIGRLVPSLGLYAVDQRLSQMISASIRENGYDCIVVRYLSTACWAGLAGKCNVPVYLDCDDYPPDNLLSEARSNAYPLVRRLIAAGSYLPLKMFADSKLKEFDGVWVSNPQNKKISSLKTAVTLPNIPWGDIPRVLPSDSQNAPTVLVVTSNNQGNMRGLDQFLSKAWPRVMQHYPKAVLRVVGAMPEEWLARWRGRIGVEVIGFAESLADEYERSTLVIAPVAAGAGTNIKVLESIKMGRCCVLSPVAARGQQFLNEISSTELLAASIPSMSERIVYLLQHPNRRLELEDELHAWAMENCGNEMFYSQVTNMLV